MRSLARALLLLSREGEKRPLRLRRAGDRGLRGPTSRGSGGATKIGRERGGIEAAAVKDSRGAPFFGAAARSRRSGHWPSSSPLARTSSGERDASVQRVCKEADEGRAPGLRRRGWPEARERSRQWSARVFAAEAIDRFLNLAHARRPSSTHALSPPFRRLPASQWRGNSVP